MESTLLHPLSPVLQLPRTSIFFCFFEHPLRNLQTFKQIFKSRPSLSNYEESNSHVRWYSLTFCCWNNVVFLIFFQTNDKAERQICMSIFKNVHYLIIDSDNASRCDFSCFHLQGAWDLCSINQINVLFTLSHTSLRTVVSGAGLSLYVTWRISRKN